MRYRENTKGNILDGSSVSKQKQLARSLPRVSTQVPSDRW